MYIINRILTEVIFDFHGSKEGKSVYCMKGKGVIPTPKLLQNGRLAFCRN